MFRNEQNCIYINLTKDQRILQTVCTIFCSKKTLEICYDFTYHTTPPAAIFKN